MAIKRMHELDLAGRRVLIREDLNVPLQDGKISSDQRLRAALPTLQAALDGGAAVLVLAHLGRPTEGEFDPQLSLQPVADWLAEALDQPVRLERDYLEGVQVSPGELVLLENCRMNAGEKADDPALAKRYAALADVVVMDAFGVAHRAQASSHGVVEYAAEVAAGPLLAKELDALGAALHEPKRPLLAIVGGAKVSTKLQLLKNLLARVDQLIVGGGIANTFLAAAGYDVGQSLYEPGLVDTAQAILQRARDNGAEIPLPMDVVVAKEFSATAAATTKPVDQVQGDDMILDVGPDTAARQAERIGAAATVVWNGPVGVFEFDAFSAGTQSLTHAIADTAAFTLAGGGDTLAAIDKYDVAADIDCISTGGGAFLEFLEGKTLPAVAALQARAG